MSNIKEIKLPFSNETDNDDINDNKEIQEEIKNIQKELEMNKNTGLYNYLSDIPREDIILYSVVLFLFIYLSNRFSISTSHLSGLFICIIFIYFIFDRNRSLYTNNMKTIEIQLNSIIPKPNYFYIDANIIELVYQMLEYRNYNSQD